MRAVSTFGLQGLRRRPMFQGLSITGPITEQSRERVELASRNRLCFAGREALSPISRNRPIDDGPTVNTFPGVENEEEI